VKRQPFQQLVLRCPLGAAGVDFVHGQDRGQTAFRIPEGVLFPKGIIMFTIVLATALAAAPAPALANPSMQCCQPPAASLQEEAASTQPCTMPSMSVGKTDQPSNLRQYIHDGRH